jgi:hypothetical protein
MDDPDETEFDREGASEEEARESGARDAADEKDGDGAVERDEAQEGAEPAEPKKPRSRKASASKTSKLDALLESLNGSAERFQTLWFSFLGLTLISPSPR